MFSNPWLTDKNQPFVTTKAGERNKNMKVAELIEDDDRCWNVALINSLFNEEVRRQILRIPFSRRRFEDGMMRLPEEKGKYTVKFDYKALTQVELTESH